ncbi:MAG: TetR/AcrR family transcriptional regulator [Bacteroidales bacterium]|nr:TetR/AcrR family transcriptional regulator [Bacteroidales bacterium]
MIRTQNNTTEQCIMEAAEALFLDKGYARTSTIEIARVVGCNQTLVHYYFRSKENLFKQVFENKIKSFCFSLLEISEEDLPFKEKLEKRIGNHFDMLKVNSKLPILLFNEVHTNQDLARKIFADVGHLPLSIIAHLQLELDVEYENGCICKTDAAALLFSIFSLNVMTFIGSPLLRLFAENSKEKMDAILEQRRAENIRLIMNSLNP